MKLLLIIASKHGSTKDIGEVVQKNLSDQNEVEILVPSAVTNLDEYEGVILGSAVYMTQWMPEMVDFVNKHRDELFHKPVWAFSVGLSGVPKGNVQDPSRVGKALVLADPIRHVTFPGRLNSSELTFRERSIARMGGAIEGDFRDWDAVNRFCEQVSQDIAEMKG